MFQVGYVHLPKLEPLRIEGGPRASDGYNPNPRPLVVSPEQLEKLRSATVAAAPQTKRKPAGRFETVGISPGDKSRIVERYKAGENMANLAMSYSVPSQRIREILVLAGVEIRPVGFQTRSEEVQPIPDLSASIQEDRSDEMPKAKRELSPEDKHIICNRYQKGKSVKDLASQFHVGLPRIREVLAEGGVPTRKQGFNLMTTTEALAPPAAVVEQVDAEPEPSQMDDPEPYTAAPDAHVIQVHDLTVTRRPYSPPCVLHEGPISELVRPGNVVAIAHMVKDLVDGLNAIPGVTADFGFTFSMTAGAR